jgi:thioredoxin 1|tara:strand:- start:16383 stop:16838 length:456 start_codon:yes stop_codon:yes gene_type:complete
MKKLIVSVLLVGLTITGFAFSNKTVNSKTEVSAEEGNGIQFQNLSLEAAKKLAKETNKLIFIDVYAAWCGPCKMMARGPFQEEKVGKVFNEKFINLKIDAEKDADGEFVSRSYGVRAYPTLLFINGDGKLVKNIVGYQTGDNLLLHAEMRK